MEWTREVRMESDEEKEKRPKKARKPRSEAPSGDEGEPRKKRRGKLKRSSDDQGDEDGAIFTDEEDAERPAKKVNIFSRHLHTETDSMSSVLRRSASLEMMTTMNPPTLAKSNCTCIHFGFWITKLKSDNSKSKEMISDSDEEMT
jgi:hypothetical protein